MSYLHNYMGLLGCMLIMVATPLVIIKPPRFNRKIITIAIFTMMGLAAIPVYDLPLVAYVRAGTGDLSITSMIILCLFIASTYADKQYLDPSDKRLLAKTMIACALMVYPLGLGLTLVDTYAYGYGSALLFALVVAYGTYLLWQQRILILTILLLAITAYLMKLLNSDNLWDYLFDPWIVFVVLLQKLRITLVSFKANFLNSKNN